MDVEKILAAMTLEEKAALCQGLDAWHTVPVERLGVPAVMVSDGPHGLRKEVEEDGQKHTIDAVCYPSAVGTASSFDPALLEEMGRLLGASCQAENVGVLLGPAANIKRSPLCGRNFEYFSEDPCLSSRMAAAHIRGVQAEGVGTSLKHFAANNQETHRMSVSAEISEQALREIYLASFEGAVKAAKPWTMMCSYNKIMGVYSSENPWLLNTVLRDEWGYDGLVMSDWGAVNDHVESVASGLDLEMPRGGDQEDRAIVEAVRSGALDEGALDEAVRHVLKLVERCVENHREGEVFDRDMQHHQARKIARESMVLLKNEGGLLPIRGNRKVAFIGDFARKPRYQGGGSSHINTSRVDSALNAVRSVCAVTYAQGYREEDDLPDEGLQAEAVRVASEADVAVVFAGLPERYESEGYDRTHMRLPEGQNRLIEAIAQAQPNVVVVLHNGSPVEMPWVDRVPGLLEAYLGGEAGGSAVVDLLFGAVSPCGKLAETFPKKLSDTPCSLSFPGDRESVVYSEGVYVGYRYYDKKEMEVLFPFGHGLTYTTFRYSDLRLSADTIAAGGTLKATVQVTNTGSMAAKEIVQFYIRPDHAGKSRPVRELKGFGKIALQPGETGTVEVTLTSRDFCYWDESLHGWFLEPGCYQVEAAASSRDIRLTAPVTAVGQPLPVRVTLDTEMGDILSIPGAREVLDRVDPRMAHFPYDLPLHNVVSWTQAAVTREKLVALAEELNGLQCFEPEA